MEIVQALAIITVVHVLALASPGADFVLVSQQTLANGRRAGLLVTLGITLGIAVHISYTAAGLAVIVAHSAQILWAIKLLGGAYLTWLGIQTLRSAPKGDGPAAGAGTAREGALRYVGMGFLCNILNPKAPLYLVTLFTVVLSTDIPAWQFAVYGAWMLVIELTWFSGMAVVLSRSSVTAFFRRFGHWVDRVLGGLLVALGLKLLLTRAA